MTRRFRAWWWTALTCVLAAGYLLIAVVSPLPAVRWPALTGAALVVAGIWFASRDRRIALVPVVVGALVPVVTEWWSVVVPITAALLIVCGIVAVRSAGDRTPGHVQLSA